MYTWDYHSESDQDSSGEKEDRTVLRAWFRFGQEVAPKDREKVEKRYSKGILIALQKDNFKSTRKDGNLFYYFDKKNGRNLRVGKCWWGRLGFDVLVTSNRNVPLEEMLDMETLNSYVLTGEIPERVAETEAADPYEAEAPTLR